MSDRKFPLNSSEQVGAGGVYLAYRPAEPRMVRPSATKVVGVGFATNPKAPWYDYGCKSFVGKRSESLPEAKAWAEEKYGIKRWKRNGNGDYVDADKPYLPLQMDVDKALKRAEAKRS